MCALAVCLSLALLASGSDVASSSLGGTWAETRFQTGCDPGPSAAPPPREHLHTTYPPLGDTAESAALTINTDAGADNSSRPILGTGFNLENALWSCPEFRGLLSSQILDPFDPAIARVDTGLLPAAPADLSASQLTPAVYQSVLSSTPYADSWTFMRQLNQSGVKIVLGVWGGPDQFTDDGTRRGTLLPSHYDDYVDYVATLVQYIVEQQQVHIWAITIANEPDGGDGNQIPPDGLAYIAHQLAPRLAAEGVGLYGPDTADAVDALQYLPLLLDDPVIADHLAFVAFHQYYASPDVGMVVDLVHSRLPEVPVIVTEYTSFMFGDLDAGQEASAQNGFTLDIASMLLSHYANGVDAALYWDAVDYLQPGHDAITRWGVLQGPMHDFARRKRYYGLEQILPYLKPGAWVLDAEQSGAGELQTLAVREPDGSPVVFLVNQAFDPVALTLTFTGQMADEYAQLAIVRTDRTHQAEAAGRASLAEGTATLDLPPRSITTLYAPDVANP